MLYKIGFTLCVVLGKFDYPDGANFYPRHLILSKNIEQNLKIIIDKKFCLT